MGIGTSLGDYYEDDLNHHAGNAYVPKEPKETQTKSTNIEDRRDDNYNSPKWENVVPTIRDLGVTYHKRS